MNETILEIERLSKVYREVRAVDGLDLSVRRGEIYGFLGRNGAGKTSTIRMLLGLITPTSGTISLFGKRLRPREHTSLARVGSLVETATAYPALTVRENLEIQRRLTGAPKRVIDKVVELLNLGEYADRRYGRLSLGNRQRLALARSLVNSPEILILDEPANGLDPAGIFEIRQILRRLRDEEGVTVFVSSHILGEVAQLVDRIGIIHRGRLVASFESDDLAHLNGHRIEVRVDDTTKAEKILTTHFAGFSIDSSGHGLSVKSSSLQSETEGGELLRDAAPQIASTLVKEGILLYELRVVSEDLESYFLRMTGDEDEKSV